MGGGVMWALLAVTALLFVRGLFDSRQGADEYWHQWILAVDQLLNVLIGSGYADETLSAFAHRRGGWRRLIINSLFFWQEDHCYQAYLSEINRKHLPRAYRSL